MCLKMGAEISPEIEEGGWDVERVVWSVEGMGLCATWSWFVIVKVCDGTCIMGSLDGNSAEG